jgi:hypothetical protein
MHVRTAILDCARYWAPLLSRLAAANDRFGEHFTLYGYDGFGRALPVSVCGESTSSGLLAATKAVFEHSVKQRYWTDDVKPTPKRITASGRPICNLADVCDDFDPCRSTK